MRAAGAERASGGGTASQVDVSTPRVGRGVRDRGPR